MEEKRDGEIQRAAALKQKITTLDKRLRELVRLRDAARDIEAYREFREIDWSAVAQEIETLKDERRRLLEESNALRQLHASLVEVEQQLAAAEETRTQKESERAVRSEHLRQARQMQVDALEELAVFPEAQREARFARLSLLQAEALGERSLKVENLAAQAARLLLGRH